MKGWDFTSPGWYFLTICTKGMKSVFGTIVKGRMILNDAGRTADQFWREIPTHFPRAVVDEYIQHCNRLVIGHLNPEGMLACILAEADPSKEIIYL